MSVRAWASVPGSASVHAWVSVSASRRDGVGVGCDDRLGRAGCGRRPVGARRRLWLSIGTGRGRRRRVRRRAGRGFDGPFRAVRGRPEWRRSCTGRRAARWGPDLCLDAARRPEPTGQRLRQDHGDHDERTCRDRPSQLEPPQERGEQTAWGDGRDGRDDIGIGTCRTGARRVVPAPSTRISPHEKQWHSPTLPPIAAGSLRRLQRGQNALGGSPESDVGASLITTWVLVARPPRQSSNAP